MARSKRRDVHDELMSLRKRDLETRERLVECGELFAGYHPEMERVHVANARRLEEILDEIGWPAASVVGTDAAAAAWLVAQHAIGLPSFQRRCLELLGRAVGEGEAPLEHFAYLSDRIRYNEGRPQVYGTILDWDEHGELSPWTIEDPASVDARRREAGLPPLGDAVARARRRGRAEGEAPPADFEARRREIEAWRHRAGWARAADPAPGRA